MATAEVMKPDVIQLDKVAIRPSSRGIVISPRPASGNNVRSLRNRSLLSRSHAFKIPSPPSSRSTSTVMLTANPNLTSIEVEAMIRQKVNENFDSIKKAFKVYDEDHCTSVTKGEFRRVLDNYCLPLTTDQFNNLMCKLPTNPNGTIPYVKFLERFLGKSQTPPKIPISKSFSHVSTAHGRGEGYFHHEKQKFNGVVSKAPKEQSIDAIERHLQHKIADNLKNVVKGLRLFDYNRDGQIQRHELRRVLDNYCLKLNDSQFDKLWSRYDFHHVGTIDYRDFLRRLGVNAAAADRQVLSNSLEADENDAPWDAKKKRLEREKDVTDLVLNRNKNRTKQKSKKAEKMTFSEIEKAFRKKMRTNFQNIERAMMAFDISSDGFIAIEDLKAVLDNFVLPTTEEVFHALMYKFEVRGTGKVSWEQFLAKFQDPQGRGNGQTLPIGQNHKVNPMRLGLTEASTPEILKLLRKHVINNFSTLKQAFLAFDENRKGVITRKDLRRIVETFTIKLSDENFKDLCVQLDPEHTGMIRYHKFLELFETKESVKAHKWLFSEHKFNEKQPPAIMAWDTIEDIMREKFSEHYRTVADEYAALDTVGNGTISRAHLRRLIDRYTLPLSDDHFNKLWCACEEVEKGRILFSRFLHNLGVDVQPGDLEGTSTRIQDQSNATEMQRVEDQQFRIDDITRVNLQHTRLFSAKDVITKLKDRMAQHDTGIRKTFLKFSKSGRGNVTKKDFRKMLQDMGFVMDDVQFLELTKALRFSSRGLNYSDFLAGFQDLRTNGMGQELERAGNHVVNPTNMKYMTAEECYVQLLERMRQNFGSVRGAFYKVDDDHDGVLTMQEFRRLLDSFMFIITDETFVELLRMLGLSRKSSLSYHDFLQKFEITDKAEGHPWLNSQHRYNKVRRPSELAADKVHDYLCIKVEQAWSDIAKAFQSLDVNGNGIVKKKELRSLLYRFILPMSNDQFKKLWSRYDEEGKGYITHQDFLKKLGKNLAPGDNLGLQGTSRKMVEENYDNVKNHHDFQQAKHEEIAYNQIKYSQHLTAEVVEKELKDRFREYYADFDKAFRKMDKNKDGYITIADLQRVLLQLNYFLDEEQFLSLLKRLGLPTTKTRLSYFDFLRAIDDGRSSKFGRRRNGSDTIRREPVTWQAFDHLPVDKAFIKLKDKITVNYDSLNSAFRAFDRAQSGLINISDFRRLLDNFCFPLSEKQFKAVLTKCRIANGSGAFSNKMINWVVFLQDFSLIKDVKLKEWTDYVGQAAPPLNMVEMSMEDIEQRLNEVVSARFFTISRAFADTDYAKIYVVSKEDFRDILNEHVMRLTDEQPAYISIMDYGFTDSIPRYDVTRMCPSGKAIIRRLTSQQLDFDRLWTKQAVNEFNNLEYREFLKKYEGKAATKECGASDSAPNAEAAPIEHVRSAEAIMQQDSTTENLPVRPPSRLGTACSVMLRPASSIGQRPLTALVNADSAESKVKTLIYRNWQEIQRECRKLDPQATGCILPDEFVGLLDRFGVMLSIEDARQLMMKYDIGEKSGMFSYREFLRHFILTLKPTDEGLLKRRKIHTARLPVDTGKENTSFIEAMIRLRERILLCWKEMRRSFKVVDPKADGYVSTSVFRQMLRQFAINLSEEDFFQLVSFYDHKMQGRVPYNDFIRAFLQ